MSTRRVLRRASISVVQRCWTLLLTRIPLTMYFGGGWPQETRYGSGGYSSAGHPPSACNFFELTAGTGEQRQQCAYVRPASPRLADCAARQDFVWAWRFGGLGREKVGLRALVHRLVLLVARRACLNASPPPLHVKISL